MEFVVFMSSGADVVTGSGFDVMNGETNRRGRLVPKT